MLTTIALAMILQGYPHWSFMSHVGEEQWESRVTQDMLARTPVWNENALSPPLPVRQAILNATKQLQEWVSDPKQSALRLITLDAKRWRFNSVALRPVGNKGGWVYVVEYSVPAPPGQFDGSVPTLRIAVLMNGEVVVPVRTTRRVQ